MSDGPVVAATLPNEASDVIAQILSEIFRYRFHREITHDYDEFRRLKDEAHRVRNELEREKRVSVALNGLLGGYDLHTVIYRDAVLAWLELKKESVIHGKVPPQDCPICEMPLMDRWTCMSCGLELESPYVRSQLRVASYSPIRFLPYHHVVLADPERRRVVILNCREDHRVVWEITQEQWVLSPWAVLFLPNFHLLVVDREHSRLVETTIFGEIVWELDQKKHESIKLRNPVKATIYKDKDQERILIVDQGNHRVISIDREHKSHWQYGMTFSAGSEDGFLNQPSDAQFTPDGHILIADTGNDRVLEIKPADQVKYWQSPDDLALEQPVYAERLPNHHIMVVDAQGKRRILELNPQGGVEEESHYYHEGLDLRYKLDAPIACIRRENQNLLIMDAQRIIEVDFLQKHMLWLSTLNGLNFEYHEAIEHLLSEDEAFFQRVRSEEEPPEERFKLENILKRVQVFQNAPEQFYKDLVPFLTSQSFAPDELIIEQGEMGSNMYVLGKGKVEVCKDDQILAVLEQGQIFGEMAIIYHEPRSASVRAKTSCQVFRLSRTAFETVVQSYPEVSRQLKDLAGKRQAVTKLKTQPHNDADKASEHLQAVLARQEHKLHDIKLQWEHRSRPVIPFKPSWRMLYTSIEQHVIHEALRSHQHCFEVHISLSDQRLSIAQASHVVAVLEQHGTVIKMLPEAQHILDEKLDERAVNQTLAIAYLTPNSKDQVLEDLTAIEDVQPVQIFSIFF